MNEWLWLHVCGSEYSCHALLPLTLSDILNIKLFLVNHWKIVWITKAVFADLQSVGKRQMEMRRDVTIISSIITDVGEAISSLILHPCISKLLMISPPVTAFRFMMILWAKNDKQTQRGSFISKLFALSLVLKLATLIIYSCDSYDENSSLWLGFM